MGKETQKQTVELTDEEASKVSGGNAPIVRCPHCNAYLEYNLNDTEMNCPICNTYINLRPRPHSNPR